MDPLSFTASLVTVSGVTIMTSKLIYKLCETLKNAPKDVGDLLEQLQIFQELLEELQKQLQDSGDNTAAQSKLPQIWGQSVAHMQRDVKSLHTKLSKLEKLLKKKSLSSKVLLLARRMLSETEIAEYQRKIDTHCGVLTCIKATVCGQELRKLTKDTIQLSSDNSAGFQMISSQVSQATGHLGAESRAGFSNVSSDLKSAKLATDEMHRDLQSRTDDHAQRVDFLRQTVDETRVRAIEITESGFQAVQSALVTEASLNRGKHESTHAMLRQLGKQLAFGDSKNCVRWPRSRSYKWGSTIPMTTLYCKTLYHNLPIGKLRISINQTRHCRWSEESASPGSTESSIEVTFVPPKWLTSLAVDYRMKLDYNSIEDQWHWGVNLRPLTVNQNPFVLDAFETLDLGAIKKSFREGLIQPRDYVFSHGEVNPWYWSLRKPVIETKLDDHKISSVLAYMIENGLPGQTYVIFWIMIFRLGCPQNFNEDLLKNYLWMYSPHAGNLLAGRFLQVDFLLPLLRCCGQGAANWLSERFLHSSQSWTVDELSSFQICLLGTVAQVNSAFRTRLKAYLASYRSPLLAARAIYADSLLESTFGIGSVLRHFHRLDRCTSNLLLVVLCRTGTPSMLRPFIGTGIDLNDDDCYDSILGHAAELGNLDIVCMLIESGANGASAFARFIRHGKGLSDGLFKHLLELLVENSRPNSTPTSFTRVCCDALAEVVQSSRALLTHPEAPEILIRRKVFSDKLIECPCKKYQCNYMCGAIRKRLRSVVELLLQHGLYANTTSTWLMFSVKCGAASCAEALIQHGADVNFVDGAGRSVLQIARSNVTAPHPRKAAYCKRSVRKRHVTAEEDADTLAVVERAFHLEAQSTTILKEHEPKYGFEVQSPNHGDQTMLVPQNIFEKALGFLFTHYRPPLRGLRVGPHCHGTGDLWSLSFYEALLMRFFYVLSYVLLLVLEILAFIQGHRRVRTPSRGILSAVALLLLAFIWGSSQQSMFPWNPDSGRSVTKQDS